MSDTPEKRRLANLKLGPEARRRKAAEKRRTEREYLLALVEELSTNDVREIARAVVEQAKGGDKDARDWLGKYLFGAGRLSPTELYHPSMIRKTR